MIKKERHSIGEIDVCAVKGNKIDIYEVKCSYRKTKAKHQLKRLRNYINTENAFFYCGNAKTLEKISV